MYTTGIRSAPRALIAAIVLTLACSSIRAADHPVLEHIDDHAEEHAQLALDIWEFAELGYLEERSSARLREVLRADGFSIREGIADLPTAFEASWGSGEPVIAVLAEFDALPGMSQIAEPRRAARVEGAPGHACGHHLFGAASVAAARALRHWLETSGTQGTIRLLGTPAEEGGSGKVYMTRAGVFDDVAAVLHWHPGDRNSASPSSSTSNKSGRFEFHGRAAHAAAAPERGRSALDGVEAMNYMVNLMREHVPSNARIHYVITNGGKAPNIVPDFAEVYYYVRHPQAEQVKLLFERVVAAAEGAAQGTGTRMEYEVMHGNFPVLPNETLARLMHDRMTALGGIQWGPEERAFAAEIRPTLLGAGMPRGSEATIQAFRFQQGMGSTDVGDVSWAAPTVGLSTATWVPGTPAHSWQAVAAGGTSIGTKGMLLAARTLALGGAELFVNAELRERAWAELKERRGADFVYEPLLGDRAPPLDYRK